MAVPFHLGPVLTCSTPGVRLARMLALAVTAGTLMVTANGATAQTADKGPEVDSVAVDSALGQLRSTEVVEVESGRRVLVAMAVGSGSSNKEFVTALTKATLPALKKLIESGTPLQSINALTVAASLHTYDGAKVCLGALDPRAEQRIGVRVAAATLLEENIRLMKFSESEVGSIARGIAEGAARETDPLVLSDELVALTTLVDPAQADRRANVEVLKALATSLRGVAAQLGGKDQSPALAAGALSGLNAFRVAINRSSPAFYAACGEHLNESLTELEASATSAGAKAAQAFGAESREAKACAELAGRCASMRDSLFKTSARGAKAGTGGRGR